MRHMEIGIDVSHGILHRCEFINCGKETEIIYSFTYYYDSSKQVHKEWKEIKGKFFCGECFKKVNGMVTK